MWWRYFPSRSEDLARAFAALVLRGGIESVTIRALARELRAAPGSIANHFASRTQVIVVSTGVIGDLLARAMSDRVRDHGLVGLRPSPQAEPEPDSVAGVDEEREYRELLLLWAHLETHSLVCAPVAEQVLVADARIRDSLRRCLAPALGGAALGADLRGADVGEWAAWWARLRGLQSRLLLSEPGLTVAVASASLGVPGGAPEEA
jgi:AcrR family transcriptional regulator